MAENNDYIFRIYINYFNQNGNFISTETLVEEVPAKSEGDLKLISPIVKAEMGNVESFDFSIQAGSKFYDAFLQMKTYLRVVYDGTTIFYGRVLTIDNTPFNGVRKVRCEGPMAFLMDSPVEGKQEETRPKITTYEYMQQLINNHNTNVKEAKKTFQLGQVPGHYTSDKILSEQQITNDTRKFGSDSWTDTKGALEDLRSHYGGYFRIRAGEIGNSKLTLDWMDHYFNSTENEQTVEIGKNIIDFSDVTEVDNIFTAIIPIGRSNVTKNDGSDNNNGNTSKQNDLYIDGKILKVPEITTNGEFTDVQLNRGYHSKKDYANAINDYGIIIKTVSLPDCTNKEKLYKEACKWILNNYQGKVTKYTVKAIDLHQISKVTGKKIAKISVGDRVRLVYPIGNENNKTTTKTSIVQTCLSIQYDLYHPENNSYTFGIPANILTKTYGLTKQKSSVTSSPDKKPQDIHYPSDDKKKWRNLVAGWLMDHLTNYRGKVPFLPEYDQNGYAKEHMNGYQLYRPSRWLIKAHYDNPDEDNWVAEKDEKTKTVTEETIAKNRVIEYVKAEYGIDLRTYWEGIYPETLAVYIDPETGAASPELLTGVWNGVTNLIDWFKITIGKPFQDAAGNFWDNILGFFGFGGDPDNPTFNPLAFFDPTGNLNFWYYDSAGKLQFKNTRDLSIESVDTENFKGQMVKDGYVDKNGNVQPHKFGLGIEDYLGGKLVVARVEGDVVQIGDEGTLWHTTVAQKISGNFLNPIEFIIGTDPKTGDPQTIRIGSAGQASYKARWDDKKGCYVYDPNGPYTLTGDGFWDSKNLAIKGGVYTVDDPKHPGKYITYIQSGQLVVGGPNNKTTVLTALKNSGVLDADYDPQKLVDSAIFTEEIFAINGHFKTIETDYLKTNKLQAQIALLKDVQMQNLSVVGTGGRGYVFANQGFVSRHYVISESAAGERGLEESLYDIQIVPPESGSNTYTLQKKKITSNLWEDVGTFSRAVDGWTDTWNTTNGSITVGVSPQNQSHTITTNLRFEGQGATTFDAAIGTVDKNGNFTRKYKKNAYLTLDSTGSTATVSVRNENNILTGTPYATISVADVWDNGYNDGLPSGISVTNELTYHDSSWSHNNATALSAFGQGTIWSNSSFSNKYGYLSFPVTVHGQTKTYYFSFDNRKLESNGNTAYGAGYKDGKKSVNLGSRTKEISMGSSTSKTVTYTASNDSLDGYSSMTINVTASGSGTPSFESAGSGPASSIGSVLSGYNMIWADGVPSSSQNQVYRYIKFKVGSTKYAFYFA